MHLPTIFNISCDQSIQMSWMDRIPDKNTLIRSNLIVHYYMCEKAQWVENTFT